VNEEEGTTSTTVHRKPTHTDQHLSPAPSHHIEHKRSAVRTLPHRAETTVTDPPDKTQEINHIKGVPPDNGHKPWMLNTIKKPTAKQEPPSERNKTQAIPTPHTPNLSERPTRILKKHGTGTHHVPTNTIRSTLAHPKDKTPVPSKCGATHQLECQDCDAKHIGETERKIQKRLNEHMTDTNKSAAGAHVRQQKHRFNIENAKVPARESKHHRRKIREAVEIRQHQPRPNQDQGREPPHIHDQPLQSSPATRTTAARRARHRR
jgi:hypothetical protein